ncbi:MAG: macro domain-containing protein [bacterium]
MKWIKDVLADAKAVFLAPVTNVLCIAGIVFLFISFLDYDKTSGITLHGQIHAGQAIAGFVLLLVGVLLFLITNRARAKSSHLDYDKGIQITRGKLAIRIQTGEIQSISASTRNAAIVLPANTTFVDDCAADKRTAMGAFFLERFPEKVATLPTIFQDILTSNGLYPDANGQFMVGTTIMLPDEFAKPAKVVITASSVRIAGTGFSSSPHVICKCVENILKCTADQRIDTIYLPILGSGHGGVERGIALLFLLLAFLHFDRAYHHIRLVQIVVHPRDVVSLNQCKELAQIVAL